MRARRWRLASGPGDFLPIIIGGVMVFVSLPAFLLLLLAPENNYGVIGVPLLVILACGALAGFAFVIIGVQMCAAPGSFLYRIAHGRFFSR